MTPPHVGANVRGRPAPPTQRNRSHARIDPHAPGDERAALRERSDPSRAHGGVHPDRRLGAVSARARTSLHVRVRRRRTRHSHHAQGGAGGDGPGGPHRADRRGAPGRLPGLRGLVRQLPHHPFAREPGVLGAHLQPAERGRTHRAQGRRPGLRPRQVDVPARPLRQGHVPELRRCRAVRGQLRGLRRHLQPRRSRRRGVGPVGGGARVPLLGALLRAPRGLRAGVAPVACGRRPERRRAGAERDRQQARRVVRRRTPGLGHLPRRPVLRIRDPRRPREVFLRLAGRADRVHGELPAPVRAAHRSRLRRCLAGGLRDRALPLRGQGHRVFPHPVLAGPC